ncbi:hypothetical protein BPY_16210 [Bifidobacterium psychraerophilum]
MQLNAGSNEFATLHLAFPTTPPDRYITIAHMWSILSVNQAYKTCLPLGHTLRRPEETGVSSDGAQR